jgi:hypothetical protein
MADYYFKAGLGDADDDTAASIGGDITREYASFASDCRRMKSANTHTFKSMVDGDTPVLQFWRLYGHEYPTLKRVALRVFSMTASSAASERNFSTMAFIHSKLRNALSPETVQMLVYVKTNFPQVNGDASCAWEDPADECEGEEEGEEVEIHV